MNLEELYLSHNSISQMEGLSSLHKLRVLDLASNKITEICDIENLTRLLFLPALILTLYPDLLCPNWKSGSIVVSVQDASVLTLFLFWKQVISSPVAVTQFYELLSRPWTWLAKLT